MAFPCPTKEHGCGSFRVTICVEDIGISSRFLLNIGSKEGMYELF
jgi:hypothetical protein